MASINQNYLLLLRHPADTIEGIQEITNLQQPPAHVDDPAIIHEHFPDEAGELGVVLLDDAGAVAMRDWAQRHKAVYTLRLVSLSGSQTQTAMHAALKIGWPCLMFLYDELTDRNKVAMTLQVDASDLSIRPARITGYQFSTPDRTRIAPFTISERAHEPNAPTLKLRPAQDVLSRLRHDPKINPSDYQVVYEDRFEGEIVLDLGLWKSDTSDEEFIPMHRILKFLRKWDGIVVWDRNSRIDLVFGLCREAIVEGFAVEIELPEQGERLFEQAPEMKKPMPCMLEFTDTEGGTARGRMFR